MSVAPTVARARSRKPMSKSGDRPREEGNAVRVEDIERALVLAREVAAATAKGGSAKLRMEHLHALFANGSGPMALDRMQAALEAAGLKASPPVTEATDSVELRVDRRRAALSPKNGGGAKPDAVTVGDAEQAVAAEQAEQNTAQSLAALMPALIVPVLAASFLGPLFGAAFAGLALVASALLSRPGALADGKLGPIHMPASLARSFLLVSFGVALGALLTSVALIAAGGSDTETTDPNTPVVPQQSQPRTTAPAPPPGAQQQRREQQAQREREEAAAARRRAERRAERRREARARQREREREAESTPPSGAAPESGSTTP